MKTTLAIAFTVGCIFSIQAEEPGKSKSTIKKEVTPPFSNYWDSNSWESVSGPKFWKAGVKKEEKVKRIATTTPVRPSRSSRRGSIEAGKIPKS